MRGKGKKIAAALLALCCAASMAGCGGKNKMNVVKGLPDYSADETTKQVYIGGYVAPPSAGSWSGGRNFITQDSYDDVAACDMDYLLTLYEQGNCEENRKALDYAQKAGVKLLVRWDAIIDYGKSTPEAMRKNIGEILEHEACWGIFAKDEPHANLFSKLGSAREVFKQITDKYFYVNLFPNYANAGQLGTKTYSEYINAYCAQVKNNMIIEDHYPLGDDGQGGYTVGRDYLNNIEIIQMYAQHYGMEHWEYIPGENLGGGSKTPDYYDFRFMFYTEMCYGVENMQYFCYWSPFAGTEGEMAAFIDSNGEKTQRYVDGAKINKEIHKFDHVYMNFAKNWKGTMTIIGSENREGENNAFDMLHYTITQTPRIKTVSATQDTIIGTYKDADGRDGFMITNYTVPAFRTTDSVTVTFNEADAVVYYKEGEYKLADLKDGKFEIDLGAGEGVFAIPVKY